MATEEPDWPALLRALDSPVTPWFEAVFEPLPGRGDGIEVPADFNLARAEERFGRLVERLVEAFGRCDYDHPQDSACFGSVTIPAEATRTRAKRTREPFAVGVFVSAFGDLATYRTRGAGYQVIPVHADDWERIEEALDVLAVSLGSAYRGSAAAG